MTVTENKLKVTNFFPGYNSTINLANPKPLLSQIQSTLIVPASHQLPLLEGFRVFVVQMYRSVANWAIYRHYCWAWAGVVSTVLFMLHDCIMILLDCVLCCCVVRFNFKNYVYF